MKSKKGVELTLNTVIVAALALIVLLVVAFIFVFNVQRINPIFRGCEEKYGAEASCMQAKECTDSEGRVDSFAKCSNADATETDKDKKIVCCLFSSGG